MKFFMKKIHLLDEVSGFRKKKKRRKRYINLRANCMTKRNELKTSSPLSIFYGCYGIEDISFALAEHLNARVYFFIY